MTHPPHSGGWPHDAQAGGGWQQPDQPVYIDAVSGQPAYLDPGTAPPAIAPPAPAPYVPAYVPYQGYPVPVMAPGRPTNGLSIAAMIVSIVGLVGVPCYGVGGIVIGLVGAILGHAARRQVKERNEEGNGMAVAGIAIGWTAVGIGVIVVGAIVALFASLANGP